MLLTWIIMIFAITSITPNIPREVPAIPINDGAVQLSLNRS